MTPECRTDRVLAMRPAPGRGVAGYRTRRPDPMTTFGRMPFLVNELDVELPQPPSEPDGIAANTHLQKRKRMNEWGRFDKAISLKRLRHKSFLHNRLARPAAPAWLGSAQHGRHGAPKIRRAYGPVAPPDLDFASVVTLIHRAGPDGLGLADGRSVPKSGSCEANASAGN
jgi:hypothetical protein